MDDEHCFVGFDAYQTVIASGVEVVLVACASKFHPVYPKAAVEAGKHVFVEKPHVIDPPRIHIVEQASEEAKQKNLSVVSGLGWRYDKAVQETIQRVLDGAIGDTVAISETDDVSGGPVSPGAEYAPATLAVRLRCGPVARDDCVRWSNQLLSALACLHREGLVHRDVKPSNCLFIDGRLKLADFGLLAQVDRSVSRVGTLEYMPPDGIMDTCADVYAAGLVIYQMITGLPAHRFPSLHSRAGAILADKRLTGLNRLAIKACQSDRDARFADAAAMLEAWEREVFERTSSARAGRIGAVTGMGRRAFKRIILAVCLVAVLVGGWAVWRSVYPLPRVEVNFITDQWDAEIWLDGRCLCQPDGQPWLTPCTVSGLSAELHTVVLKRQDLEDLELGRIDFGKTREVTAHWETASAVDSGTTRKDRPSVPMSVR